MAWRIADSVTKGEIDSRTPGRVSGKIWIVGREMPVVLELTGKPHRDLAGQYLRFINPAPKPLPEHLREGFATEQTGVVGDMTAARKVKILDIPDEAFEHYYKNKIPMPYHWGNCLYLEWYSVRNGRVVIEATGYELTVEPEATWHMSEEEEAAQLEANGRALVNFMNTMLETDSHIEAPVSDEDDDDAPQSEAEAIAEAEAARMDLLNDRIQARMEKEGQIDADSLTRIMKEERERLRRERGEPEARPLNPEEEEERIEHLNYTMERILAEEDDLEVDTHPLVEQCQELGHHIRDTIEYHEWLPEKAHEEHPLQELMHGIWSASAKLAGALNLEADDWPPDPLFAGHTLVRLKKAKSYLADALAGLDAAEAEKLCSEEWLASLRQEILGIQKAVQDYINEVRCLLRDSDDIPF